MGRNSPYKKSLDICNCIKNNKSTSKDNEVKIEDFKEDLYINKKSMMGHNNFINYNNNIECDCIRIFKDINYEYFCICKDKENCICKLNNKEQREYAENIYKFINKSKNEIYNDFKDTSLDHFFRFNSSQFSLPIKENYNKLINMYKINEMKGFLNYPIYKKKTILNECDIKSTRKDKDIKIEELKEELFINKNGRFSDTLKNNNKPNKKSLKYCACIDNDKANRISQEVKIEDFKCNNQDNYNPYKNRIKICDCITNDNPTSKDKDIKIEELKEEFYLYKHKCFGSERERIERQSPNKTTQNICGCIKDNKSTGVDKEVKIEELKEDLYLIKKSWFGDNKQNNINKDLL